MNPEEYVELVCYHSKAIPRHFRHVFAKLSFVTYECLGANKVCNGPPHSQFTILEELPRKIKLPHVLP